MSRSNEGVHELPCKRFRIKLSGDDIYIVISYRAPQGKSLKPWEIFATAPCSWAPGDQRKVFMEAVNRLTVLALQGGVATEDVVDQLEKSSAGNNDYLAKLAGLLERGEVL